MRRCAVAFGVLILWGVSALLCLGEVSLEDRLEDLGVKAELAVPETPSRGLFDYDPSQPLEARELGRWLVGKTTFIDIEFESPRGGVVPATLAVPFGDGPFAGLVIQHGMPSNRQSEFTVAQIYASLGAVVLMIDAPFARPENVDRPPIQFSEQDYADQVQLIVDLQRGVDLLLARDDVDPDRIGFLGISYGAAIGGLLAGVETRVRAYALVVGGGGLVGRHLLIPEGFRTPFDELTTEEKRAWVRRMWPIETVHYVSRASPAALLLQNGTDDMMVIPASAERLHHAASEPKTVLWYASGHRLPFSHLADQAVWFHDQIGTTDTSDPRLSARLVLLGPVEETLPFFPNRRGLALLVDRSMLGWFALMAGSLIWMGARVVRSKGGRRWAQALVWIPSALLLGPLALAAECAVRRHQPSWLRGSAGWQCLSQSAPVAVGTGLGIFLLVVLARLTPALLGSPVVLGVLLLALPHAGSLFFGLLADWGGGRSQAARLAFLDRFLLAGAAQAAGVAVLVSLIARWLDVWYPAADWTLASPGLLASLSVSALAGALAALLPCLVLGEPSKTTGEAGRGPRRIALAVLVTGAQAAALAFVLVTI